MLSANEVTPGLYRHYKGNLYEVIGVASHSETEESLVVYRALYGSRGMWVRPFAMFTSDVEVEGRSTRRFAPVDSGPATGSRGSVGRGSVGRDSGGQNDGGRGGGDRGSMER